MKIKLMHPIFAHAGLSGPESVEPAGEAVLVIVLYLAKVGYFLQFCISVPQDCEAPLRGQAQHVDIIADPALLRPGFRAPAMPIHHILQACEIGLQAAQHQPLTPALASVVELEMAGKLHPAPGRRQHILLIIHQIQVVGSLHGQEGMLKVHRTGDSTLGWDLRVDQILQGARSEGPADGDLTAGVLSISRGVVKLLLFVLFVLVIVVVVGLSGVPARRIGQLVRGAADVPLA